ncbi:MAG: SpoIIE family protein phosphatase [Balneolaceae bacterium]|nr:SpoIIE family protein phosphatase [Balneolaceae bacterium]
MIPGSDTAKQDIILLITGLIAAFLFYWLYTDLHPLRVADSSLGLSSASDRGVAIANQFGYRTSENDVTSFKINQSFLDSLQSQTSAKEFYVRDENRTLYPAFYWQTNLKVADLDQDAVFGFMSESAKTVSVLLNERGEFIAIQNSHDFLPMLRTSGTEQVPLESTESSEPEFIDQELEQFLTGEFNQNVALELAGYYFKESGWPENIFLHESTELFEIDEVQAAKVTYLHSSDQIRQNVQVEVTVLENGSILQMDYTYLDTSTRVTDFTPYISGVRAIVILFAIFWIFVLLFNRFRLRLVDTKAAILIAVLAGLLFPFLITLQQLYSHISSFGSITFSFILPMLITIGFFAAITSVGFFAVTAISDSITRQIWVDKLRTYDLIRTSHFFNVPVGVNIIRGISLGFVISAVWCIVIYLIPGTYITVPSEFISDTTYLPYIAEILSNFAIAFIIVQVIFLIFLGQFRSAFKSDFMVLLLPAVMMSVVYPFPFDVGGLLPELLTAGVVGLLLGLIYLKNDFITTFISLFVFFGVVSTAPGWLLSPSPDIIVFLPFALLLVTGYLIGAYNIYKGKTGNELPDFVPGYIRELAQEDRIKQELQIARQVQQSFLPVARPAVDGFDIAAICKPAYETGGDYFDFISLSDDKLAITIGDVSGKGIQAAFYMTFIKGVLHALCNDFSSPGKILSKTNKLFRRNANKSTFISLIFGVLDIKKAQFRFSRAGHNPVLFYNSKKGKLYPYQPSGLAIGMANEELFDKHITEDEIKLNEGDILILFTDGVVETISKTNKLYGDHRLHNLIMKYNSFTSLELIQRMEEDLKKFGDKHEQHDDLTMIVVKKK